MTTQWVTFQTYQELQDLKAQVAALTAGARIVGSISIYAGASPPPGFLFCKGQQLATNDYPELYALIGTTFGAPQAGFFNLPDLQGRFPQGSATGGSSVGTVGGSGTLSQVPAHSHTLTDGTAKVSSIDSGHTHASYANLGGLGSAGPPFLSTDPQQIGTATSSSNAMITSQISGRTDTEGTNAVSIINPFIVLNYIICYSPTAS